MEEQVPAILGIGAEEWAQTPPTVRLALLSLLEIVHSQRDELKQLQTVVRDLQAQLRQNSRNSSKPPSSDPPSTPPPTPRAPRGRLSGGQKGHPPHNRPLLPPDEVDTLLELRPHSCPFCLGVLASDLAVLPEPVRHQVWELPRFKPIVSEYRQHRVCCPSCARTVIAALPEDVPRAVLGPRASALAALLRSCFRLSLDETVRFFDEVCHLPLSCGCVVASCERVSEALAPVEQALHTALQAAASVNVDETSWSMCGKSGWLWVAHTPRLTYFRLDSSRGRQALRQLLSDDFRGYVTSDRLASYKLFQVERRQVCWAHLLRNVQALEERYGEESGWARAVLTQIDDLFFVWHRFREGWYERSQMQQALLPIQLALHEQLLAGRRSAHTQLATFSRELLGQWEGLWTFSRVEEVEPTNNAAERALRPAVLWRKGCFGSRSESGCRFVERLLSVRATCAQQGKQLFSFLADAVAAACSRRPPPPLLSPP